MSHLIRAAAALSLSVYACACVAEVKLPVETSGDGGSMTASSSSAGGSGGAGAGGSGGGAACVPQPYDPDAGFMEPTCADLAVMTVSDPSVKDDSGDGKVSPGEGVVISVKLSEIAGKGFNDYPGVTFTSDLAMVTDPESAQLYAILPCQVDDLDTHIVVPASVPKGTVVHVTARVSALNMACPDADAITIPITVE